MMYQVEYKLDCRLRPTSSKDEAELTVKNLHSNPNVTFARIVEVED